MATSSPAAPLHSVMSCTSQEKQILQERKIREIIEKQNGIIFAQAAFVHRQMYRGRDIIAQNSDIQFADDRGYFKVERWIMSLTEAENEKKRANEGLTRLILDNDIVLLQSAVECAGDILFGKYRTKWPLTKVLDIGGPVITPKFSNKDERVPAEVPPIPCHVHSGLVHNGHLCGQGKTEAYFFPPLDVPPYNIQLKDVITRLGFKPETSKGEILENLKKFGITDDLYSNLNQYEIHPWETWHIESRVVHAPGPWLTFEIQRSQDDFNILAWQLGRQLGGETLQRTKENLQLRGLADEKVLFEEAIDWDMNTDEEFQAKWWHKCEVLEEGKWGKRFRLFYNCFYGEGISVNPGSSYTRIADQDGRPFAAIIWSGAGTVNGLEAISCSDGHDEFLVTPKQNVTFTNQSADQSFMILSVYPIVD